MKKLKKIATSRTSMLIVLSLMASRSAMAMVQAMVMVTVIAKRSAKAMEVLSMMAKRRP